MANLWNKRNLPLPARSDCRIDDRKLDLKFYQRCLRDAMYALEHPHLQAEAALLSRCIYRMKTKFRNDKGVKELQKINIGLRRYLTLDLPHTLERFLNTLPAKKTKGVVYPTLGNLDYLLTRLQGTVKLLARIAECAKYSVHYMNNRISIGHFWNVACIVVGMAARVFALMKSAVKICCALYNDLFGLRGFLKGVSGYEDEEQKLPEDLKKWLDDDWLFEEVIVEDFNENLLRLKKTEMNDVEFCDEYVEIDDDVDLVDEYIDMTRKYKSKVADSNLREITINEEGNNSEKNNPKINKKTIKHFDNNFYSENNHTVQNHKSIKSNKNNSNSIEIEEDIGQIIDKGNIEEEDIGEIINGDEDQSIENDKDTSEEDIGEIISRDEDPFIENDEDIGEPVENDETVNEGDNETIKSEDIDENTKMTDINETIVNYENTSEEDIDEYIDNDNYTEEEDFNEPIENNKSCEEDINEPIENNKTCEEVIDELIEDDDTDIREDFGKIFKRNDDIEKSEKKHLKKRKIKSNEENVPKKKLKLNGNKINKDNIKSKKKQNQEHSGGKHKIALSQNFNENNKMAIKNINQHSVYNHKVKTTIKDNINVHNSNDERVNADQIKKLSNTNVTNGNNLEIGKKSKKNKNSNVSSENGTESKKNKNFNGSSKNEKESKINKISNVSPENQKESKKNKNCNVSSDNVKKSKKNTNSQNSGSMSKSKVIENKSGPSTIPKTTSTRSVINSIHTISELKLFVKKESKLRDLDLKNCKLKHLNKMQWNMLSNLVNGFVNKAKKNEKKTGKFLEKGKEALLMNIQ